MAKRRTIGNTIAPPRYLLFIAALVIGSLVAARVLGNLSLGFLAGFDAAAALFLLSCLPLLGTREEEKIRQHAAENDAKRSALLVVTGIVMAVLLVAIASESVGKNPQPLTKVLIILTLIIAWLFSNMIYALHYAHMAYINPRSDCHGFGFPETPQPGYWDFVYFAFTCGMAFSTSDVQVTRQDVRKVVMAHCLAAFGFNIGVLAFTINLLAAGGS